MLNQIVFTKQSGVLPASVKKLFLYLIIINLSVIKGFSQKTLSSELERKNLKIFTLVNKQDTIQGLIKRNSDEQKPVIVFIQGSLPRPLGFTDSSGNVGVAAFPFKITKEILNKYHFVSLSKTSVPPIVPKNQLNSRHCFVDNEGNQPKKFLYNDYLSFHVNRHVYFIDKFLKKQKWVDKEKIILAGHSQGAYIACMTATKSKNISHLIFSGSSPYGRIMRMLLQSRNNSKSNMDNFFKYWQEIVTEKENKISKRGGDSPKSTYTFSQPIIEDFLSLKIPTLVTYGLADEHSPFVDLTRIEAMRREKKNIKFIDYKNRDHNFFLKTKKENPSDYFGWNIVFDDWLKWISDN